MVYAGELDSFVLQMLCEEPGPWAEDELGREFQGATQEVGSALVRLMERGMVRQVKGGLLVATASGRYANALNEGTP